MRVRLEGQPLAVLQMLLDRPGELVTPRGTTEKALASGYVCRLRTQPECGSQTIAGTLNDSADQPRYIETLARRGYRFVAPTNGFVADREIEKAVLVPGESRSRATVTFRLQRLWPFVAAAVCFSGIALWGWRQSRNRPHHSHRPGNSFAGRTSLAKPERRSIAGILCRWDDRGAHRTPVHDPWPSRHLPHIGDAF